MASLFFGLLSGIFKKRQRAADPVPVKWRKRFVDQGQLDELRISTCQSLDGCHGMCCHKGVRMPTAEAERIARFVEAHPEHFAHLKRVAQPLVSLEKLGMPRQTQTEVVTPSGVGKAGLYRALFAGENVGPAENVGSMCVFALADGRCSIQVASVELGFHKWEHKPTVCWLFPLKSVMFEENDGCRYYRLDYAGYAERKHADYPCARLDTNARLAKDGLKEEIEYYRKEFIGEEDGETETSPTPRYANMW